MLDRMIRSAWPSPPRRDERRKTEVVVASLEMLSDRSKKESAKEAQAVAHAPDGTTPTASNGAADESLEAVVAI